MEGASLSLLIAFSAGLLSFLSPCVLPLVPSYVTFITGMSLEDLQKSRRNTFLHAVLFVCGFTLIFLALGAGATMFGQLMLRYRDWISRIGGVLVIIFGLYMLGVLNLGLLARDTRLHLADKPLGYLGTLTVGIAFGAGWSPCIGPILGAILTMAANEADLQRGLVLLLTYSLGLAVPFLLAAVMVERFLTVFAKLRHQMIWVNRIAGALLVIVGVLMVTNRFTMLASWLQDFTPAFIRDRICVQREMAGESGRSALACHLLPPAAVNQNLSPSTTGMVFVASPSVWMDSHRPSTNRLAPPMPKSKPTPRLYANSVSSDSSGPASILVLYMPTPPKA